MGMAQWGKFRTPIVVQNVTQWHDPELKLEARLGKKREILQSFENLLNYSLFHERGISASQVNICHNGVIDMVCTLLCLKKLFLLLLTGRKR